MNACVCDIRSDNICFIVCIVLDSLFIQIISYSAVRVCLVFISIDGVHGTEHGKYLDTILTEIVFAVGAAFEELCEHIVYADAHIFWNIVYIQSIYIYM